MRKDVLCRDPNSVDIGVPSSSEPSSYLRMGW
jgi:hypothetical protein